MGLYEISGDESLLGLDEIMGADEYLLGASPRRMSLARAAQTRAAGGVVVANKAPTASRELPLGFDSVTAVTKSTSAKVTSKPQKTFRPDRLVVANAVAPFFLIDDIKIGTNSQLTSSDSIPAEAFSNLSVGVRMKMDTANIGIDVTLSVSNIDTLADHRFNGTLIGPAIS